VRLETGPAADGRVEGDEPDRETLLARLETLEDETERLRRELADARRRRYRRTALGLALVGALAVGGAVLFPDVREVLLALGGTGLFGALLVYYLTPERFVAASVGESVYDALAGDLEAVAAELELSEAAVYVPVGGDPAVRLYVPEVAEGPDAVPDPESLGDALVVEGAYRGLSLRPTGDALRGEFSEAAAPLPDSTPALCRAACDALLEQFELVEAADPDLDAAGGRLTVRVADSPYGPLDRLDHPVASFLASTLAAHLERPVELSVAPGEEGSYLVTCRWAVGAGCEAGYPSPRFVCPLFTFSTP
jgi:hypothetical protein